MAADPTNPAARVAFMDESHRELPGGTFGTLLATVVIREADEAQAVAIARSCLRSGQVRFHWTKEPGRSRRAFVEAFVRAESLKLEAVVAAVTVPRARRIEHGRVQALWPVLGELDKRRVGRLIMESRLERNDRNDRREIEHAKAAGLCPGLVYAHHRPLENPALWIPDALAGAASAALFGDDSDYWELWKSNPHNVTVTLLDQNSQ